MKTTKREKATEKRLAALEKELAAIRKVNDERVEYMGIVARQYELEAELDATRLRGREFIAKRYGSGKLGSWIHTMARWIAPVVERTASASHLVNEGAGVSASGMGLREGETT